MPKREKFRPFTCSAEGSFQLQDPPLAMVLCQVRWPEMSHFREASRLQAAVSKLDAPLSPYPIIEEGHEAVVVVSPDGVRQQDGGPVYKWSSIDGSWRVNLARRSLSLTCSDSYVSYADFSARLQPLLGAILTTLEVPLLERIGLRYVNQLSARLGADRLANMLTRHHGLPRELGQAAVARQIEQVVYELQDGLTLHVRAGDLPAGESFDPSIPPLADPSWIVDLDAFTERRMNPDPDQVMQTCGRLSDACFDYFKFIATRALVEEFGGTYDSSR